MDGTDAGFMALKHDHWWMTLPAVTHGTWPVMLVCSKNILRAIWLGFHRQTWNYCQCRLSLNGGWVIASKKIIIMKVLLICTSTSRAWACISVMVHQQTSDLQWKCVCGRQCVQGNGNTNALAPRVSVLIFALSNSRLPHMSFTHTCQKAGSIRRGLSYRT